MFSTGTTKLYCSVECRTKANLKAKRKLYEVRDKKNPQFIIKQHLRSRLSSLIRLAKAKKYSSSTKLVGCDLLTLVKHIERQFKKGMSWDNHGKWHLDHKVPCNSFDLTNLEEQKICFHYTNLQPLWAKDNIRKKDKIEQPIQLRIAI